MARSAKLWEEWGQAAWHEPFQAFVGALAIARILAAWWAFFGLAAYPDLAQDATFYISSVQTLIFGVCGLFLYSRSAEDPRARSFGLCFLLIANAYVGLPISTLFWALEFRSNLLMAPVLGLAPEVFLPFFFWIFVERFPSSTTRLALRRIIVQGRRLALWLGGLLFLLGAIRVFGRVAGVALGEDLDNVTKFFFYGKWLVLYPLMIIALPVFFLKFRQQKGEERRNAGQFFYAYALFWAAPSCLILVEELIPKYFNRGSLGGFRLFLIYNLLVALFPLATTYSVLTQRVLDVQTIARRAMQYLLTRYSVLLASLAPILFLSFFGWMNRNSTLAELFSSGTAIYLLVFSVLGLLALRYRQPLLEEIDRRFFRERYSSRRVLADLIGQLRGSRGLEELARRLERGVDLALHLERVSLLVEKSGAGRFVDPLERLRPLDPGSPLVTIVAGSREPILADLEGLRSPFRALPEEDKLWLVDNRVEMLAAVCSLDGHPIGLLALGRKRSELPFLGEDRDLLAAVASSAGLVIELLQLRESAAGSAAGAAPAADEEETAVPDEIATACVACDRLYPPGSAHCSHCQVALEKTGVPYILRDLYRLDFRLGAGGMAVVYRAKDLKLGRPVAVKTLPRVNAEAAMRLRREARTAASVSHPGLAAIYGLETWRGVPMIITELLAGGTLADQLGREPLAAIEAIDMARTIALALAKIHGAGILHRDVKPSNIGYTEDGDVKLLDFGIARIQHDFRREQPDGGASGAHGRIFGSTTSVMLPRTKTGQLVGTVTYLSPEAARGEKPDPGVDLWALAVCVHEALTAENLFYGRNLEDVLEKIRATAVPDVRKTAPACPEPLARFLAAELSLDRSRRAEDGLEMATRLAEVRARILAA